MAPDPREAFDVSGRVAIITGAGRGLGKAMAAGLARVGARVVAVSRTQSDLDDTIAEIRADGGEGISVRADVGDYAVLDGVVEAAVERFGRVDILVNNAADPYHTLIAEMTSERLERSYRVNVFGPTLLSKSALPYLEASGHGSVINVSSAAVFTSPSGFGPYRSAKGALLHMTRCMAKEWAPKVRVNSLVPGPFETTSGGGYSEEQRALITARAPFGRIASDDEIVPHVLYLASDASAFVTGTELMVDGGIVNGKGDNEAFKAQFRSMTETAEARERAAASSRSAASRAG